MARRRRKPLSPIAWLLVVIISVGGSYAVYRVSVSAIQDMTQHQTEKAQAAIQKLQQQQARQRLASPPRPTPEQLAKQQAVDPRRQAELVAAARLRQAELAAKDDAWEHFYQPSRACMYPESDQRKQVCEASANKARQRFEKAWAAGQLQTHR